MTLRNEDKPELDSDFAFTFDEDDFAPTDESEIWGEDEDAIPALYDFTGIEDDPEAVTEFLVPNMDKVPEIEDAVSYDDEYAARPPKERTDELFVQMKPYRRILNGLLEMCETPIAAEEVEERFKEMDRDYKSTYSCINICSMLTRAGALERVNEEGTPLADVKVEPDIIEEDGVEYMVAAQPPKVYFLTTETGREKLAEYDPASLLDALFEKESTYFPIYKRVLTMAAEEGGTNAAALSYAVDSDPLVQKPRFFVQHFLENLERCDAVAWKNKTWVITPLGRSALDGVLAGVVDDFDPATDGVPEDVQDMIAAEESLGAVW